MHLPEQTPSLLTKNEKVKDPEIVANGLQYYPTITENLNLP
jgi:hypothetical protein